MTKILLLNGPPKAGKDYAADWLKSQNVPLVRRECKDKLHQLVMDIFRVEESIYWYVYNNRRIKETPVPLFGVLPGEALNLCSVLPVVAGRKVERYGRVPLSLREALVYISECVIKPALGKDYFGMCRAESLQDGELAYDGSTGFEEELPPLVNTIGQDNILLLRIHRDGCSFGDGDSRQYISDGVIHNTVDIINNGTLEEYYTQVYKVVREFLCLKV